MKNENIKKINTLGKVSRIIFIILRIFLIIEIVASLIIAIAFCTIPKSDIVTADGTISAQIKIDYTKIPSIIFSDDFIDIDENDIDFNAFGMGIKWFVEKNKVDNNWIYDIEGKFDIDNSRAIIMSVTGTMALCAVLGAIMLIVVIFGGKLAKALETCNSPFEENVLRAMKKFAFSFIPVAVLEVIWNGKSASSITTIFIVIVILMLTFIFNYGAELQKESDETI